ncbi:MAG: hypothetical protein JRH20_14230 [Deltaproteobacteria bacterium]|nr:hypothetical protein [Deltaproteobacteria bacterium]
MEPDSVLAGNRQVSRKYLYDRAAVSDYRVFLKNTGTAVSEVDALDLVLDLMVTRAMLTRVIPMLTPTLMRAAGTLMRVLPLLTRVMTRAAGTLTQDTPTLAGSIMRSTLQDAVLMALIVTTTPMNEVLKAFSQYLTAAQ